MKLFSWLLISLLVFSSIALAEESDVDKLLDLLVEKGVLKKDDAAGFRADLAVKKQEEKETKKEFNVVAAKPIKISGYTQVRFQSFAEDNKTDSFDIRRARLDIRGDITERFDYRFQGEFGGNKGPFLLDATAGYKFSPWLKATAGQFKIPFSLENLTSSPKLETINRSQVVEALVARGKDVIGNQNGRDIGVQASGSFFQKDDRYLFDYTAGIFDGAGINTLDNNDQKDFVGRLVFHPIKGLDVGGSFYNGFDKWNLNPSDPKSVPTNQDRDRVGAEIAYVNELLSLKGEYIAGVDGNTDKDGWYVQGGYFIFPKKLEAVLKYDTFDPDKKKNDNESDVYTLGANWYFNKWAFLQANYEIKRERNKEIDNNVFTGQLTLQF